MAAIKASSAVKLRKEVQDRWWLGNVEKTHVILAVMADEDEQALKLCG
jgi:hypothetical protein